MPSSVNRKWRVGSSKGELRIGFSMTTCAAHPFARPFHPAGLRRVVYACSGMVPTPRLALPPRPLPNRERGDSRDAPWPFAHHPRLREARSPSAVGKGLGGYGNPSYRRVQSIAPRSCGDSPNPGPFPVREGVTRVVCRGSPHTASIYRRLLPPSRLGKGVGVRPPHVRYCAK